jgi:hypothetical protein
LLAKAAFGPHGVIHDIAHPIYRELHNSAISTISHTFCFELATATSERAMIKITGLVRMTASSIGLFAHRLVLP